VRLSRGRNALLFGIALGSIAALALYVSRRRAEPRVLLGGVNAPAGIAPAGASVVVSVFEGGKANSRALLKVPMDGQAPVRLASAQMGIPSIAADAGHAYWLSYLEGKLSSVPLASGPAIALAAGLVRPFGIGLRGGDVYFTTRRAGHRSLMKVGKQGGEPVVLVEEMGGVQSLRVTAGGMFWTADGSIFRVGAGGGTPFALAKGRNHPTALDVAGGYAYYAVSSAVERVPVNGGAVQVLARIPGRIVAVVADGDTVYAATARPLGRLLRLPAGGGSPVAIADVPEGVSSIALGPADLLATTDAAPGKLLAVPR
jgi:hypothetical protein